MIVYTLKMCTFYFVNISLIFSHLERVELDIFHQKSLDDIWFM